MQAGVPLVPVVLRNAGQLMWRGQAVVHPGTLQVAVLPPIPTDGWRVAELDERVAEVREQFISTLEHWPGERRPPTAPRTRAPRSARRQPTRTG
jgi:1-acyl-sn-glycerol-3-phosphate acyltransferase